MAVLTQLQLLKRLTTSDTERRLSITPLLDWRTQVGPSSVDIRLGPEILVTHRSGVGVIDMGQLTGSGSGLLQNIRHVYVGFRQYFTLHPGEFVLGSSLEYLRLPPDLCCSVEGRSTIGRAGVVIATATSVAPGFCGCLTLEIENLGEVPIRIFPGVRIAQLVFFKSFPKAHYVGRYRCATGPEAPRFDPSRDKELRLFRPPQETT